MFDQSEYHKVYYKKNKARRIVQIRERQREYTQIIQAYKLKNGCSVCGYKKSARALQFHHKNDKKFNISRMCAQGRNLDKIMLEIEKCDILCANCHAELHDMGLSANG